MAKKTTATIWSVATVKKVNNQYEINFPKENIPTKADKQELVKAGFWYYRKAKDGHNTYFWLSNANDKSKAFLKDKGMKVKRNTKKTAETTKTETKAPVKRITKEQVEKKNTAVLLEKLESLPTEKLNAILAIIG